MSDPPHDAWKPHSNPWLIAVVVTLGAFMEVLDTTIVNVSLPHIAGSLSVSNDESAWALTTYLVANGIVLTISGSLGRRLGRKHYFLTCIAGFTIASFACGTADAFWEILVFRALQGLFGGGLQPTQQAIILDHFPPERRRAAFSLTAVAIIIAPIVGPVLGGWLTDTYSWHWIFLINVPIGVVTFLSVMRLLEDPPYVRQEKLTAPPFDYIGAGLIALTLGSLEIATDRGEDYDWLGSEFIRIMFLLSAAGFLFGIVYLYYARQPIVDLRVYADRNFALGSLQIAIMGLVLYASAVLIPEFAQEQLGYTATWAGLVLAPGAVVVVMLIPVVGRLLASVPAKYVIAFGGFALGAALLYSRNLVPDLDFYHLVLLRGAQSAGLAFLFVPISTIAYATLPQSMNGDATALFNMARNVFGGVGISISTSIVADYQQVDQQNLVANLAPTSQPYLVLLHQIEQALVNAGYSFAQAAKMAPGEIYNMLQTQVAVLAYTEVFFITACLAFLLVPAALFMSGGKPQRSKAGMD